MSGKKNRSSIIFPRKPTLSDYSPPYKTKDRSLWYGYFSHDPAIYFDKASGYYYIYSTDSGPGAAEPAGGQIRRSKDLIKFEYIGTAINGGVPDEAVACTGAKTIWAPDIVKHGSEYRLYYSASTFGSQRSAIGLAVSSTPEGPFLHKGIVIKTTQASPVNAIDANIVVEEGTGQHYLVYGSFWGGIRILKLDNKTGFAAENGYGIPIACRNRSVDGAIEGAYIRYNPETKYYYLFVSYESLTNHYNVRVARSKSIIGPYLDYNGVSMTNLDANPYEVGLKLTTGYSFEKGRGWFAFGHNSVLNQDGEWYMVCHARMESNPYISALHVHKIVWTDDGWPLVSPFQYAGEKIQTIPQEIVPGTYARVNFELNMDNIITPYTLMELYPNGTCKLDFTKNNTNKNIPHTTSGRWELNGYTLTIQYNDIKETIFLIPSWDYEKNTHTIALTGINQKGVCLWGKKLDL